MGVARVVLSTVRPSTAAGVLVDEFGFDRSLQALAVLPGDAARSAFGEVWSGLVLAPLAAELPPLHPREDDGRRSGHVHG